MAGDLGGGGAEVHEAAAVLAFWFDELEPEQHWAKDPALDARISVRFRTLGDRLLSTGAAGWRDRPETLLAAVIVLDQFSRNIFRGHLKAFQGDRLALELAGHGLRLSWDVTLPPERRVFLYMPFEHSEDPAMQAVSLRLFKGVGDEKMVDYARQHARVIADFGRFPGRNAALGRESTAAERVYLAEGGGF